MDHVSNASIIHHQSNFRGSHLYLKLYNINKYYITSFISYFLIKQIFNNIIRIITKPPNNPIALN
jgi:hypothetical protein